MFSKINVVLKLEFFFIFFENCEGLREDLKIAVVVCIKIVVGGKLVKKLTGKIVLHVAHARTAELVVCSHDRACG